MLQEYDGPGTSGSIQGEFQLWKSIAAKCSRGWSKVRTDANHSLKEFVSRTTQGKSTRVNSHPRIPDLNEAWEHLGKNHLSPSALNSAFQVTSGDRFTRSQRQRGEYQAGSFFFFMSPSNNKQQTPPFQEKLMFPSSLSASYSTRDHSSPRRCFHCQSNSPSFSFS